MTTATFITLNLSVNKFHGICQFNPFLLKYRGTHTSAISPDRRLQNKVCRRILSLERMTSKQEIYPKMGKLGLEGLYKYRMIMFMHKNRDSFDLHTSISNTRMSSGLVAAVPNWRKYHSRTQAKFQGSNIFNKLPVVIRNEGRVGLLKRNLKAIL